MLPQLAVFEQPNTPQAQFAYGAFLGSLTRQETQERDEGLAQAVANGTYFIAHPFHCAVGAKARDGG